MRTIGGTPLLARARAATLTNYAEIARCVGVDPNIVLTKAGLQHDALDDDENWLPGQKILTVLDETADLSGRDDFALLLGEVRTFASLGPVSLLLRHELTLGSMMRSLIEYRKLVNEMLNFRLQTDGRCSFLEWSLVPGLRSSQGVHLLAAMAYRFLVDAAAVNWRPECIHFHHAPPRHAATFRRVFRCPIEFDSVTDGLSFQSASLEIPNAFADAGLTAHARRLLNLLPGVRDESLVDRARGSLAFLLHSGRGDAANVADSLGLSVRTLQRRLATEGHSFGGLVNEVRRELAVRYLGHSGQSVTDVAQLTGYATTSSFTRWFAAEFGMPPGEWRRLNRRG